MRASLAALGCGLLSVACTSETEAIPYSFGAFERPSAEWPEQKVFLKNARKILTDALVGCDVQGFRYFQGARGEIVFAFDVPKSEETDVLKCLQNKKPNGSYLEKAYFM